MPDETSRDLLDGYDKVRERGWWVPLGKELARAHPDVFIEMVKALDAARLANTLMDEDVDEMIWRVVDPIIQRSTRIEAIKKYRDLLGCGLKEAKEAVERRVEELGGNSLVDKF